MPSDTIEAFDSSMFASKVEKIVSYDLAIAAQMGNPAIYVNRLSEIDVGTSGNATADYQAVYDYDNYTQRLTRVTGPGLSTYGVVYSYQTGSNLVSNVIYKSATNSTQGSTVRSFEAKRDLLASVESKWPTSATISKYAYLNDALGRRTECVRTGSAFPSTSPPLSGPNHDVWTYNDRNELTGSTRYDNGTSCDTNNHNAALDRGYHYDPIGNRTDSTEGTNSTIYYCANNLNQYSQTATTTQPCASTQPAESFTYDLDGNLTQDARFDYEWDAENRLVRVTPRDVNAADPPSGAWHKVEFRYDYMGRRVEKLVYDVGSPWTASAKTRFLYYNWLLLAEYSVNLSTQALTLQHKYTWGLDLAGLNGQPNSITSAGGIGGLLAAYDTLGTSGTSDDKRYAYLYDGNGNVTQLIDMASTGTLVTRYEYDAFGNLTGSWNSGTSMSLPATNCARFQTKCSDCEINTSYFGFRILAAKYAIWLTRDPLDLVFTGSLTRYVDNNPVNRIDGDGRQSRSSQAVDLFPLPPAHPQARRCAAAQCAPYARDNFGVTLCDQQAPCHPCICIFGDRIGASCETPPCGNGASIIEDCTLRHEYAHYRNMLDNGSCGIFSYDPTMNVTGGCNGTGVSIPTDNDECSVRGNTFRCLADKATSCLNGPNPCECVQMIYHLILSLPCANYDSGPLVFDPPPPPTYARHALEQTLRHAK